MSLAPQDLQEQSVRTLIQHFNNTTPRHMETKQAVTTLLTDLTTSRLKWELSELVDHQEAKDHLDLKA